MALRKDGNSRSSASYKPYDPSNSFVKKMTNTVTGLFGWRSSLQSDSQHFNDILNSSSEDDRVAPAAKRMKVQCDEDKTLLKFLPSSSRSLQEACSPIKPINDVNAGPSNRNKCIISSTPANAFYKTPAFCNTLSDQSSSRRVTQNVDDSEATDASASLPQFSVHQRHNITVPSLSKDVPNMMFNVDANKSISGSFSSTNSRRPSFNVDVFSSSSRRLSLSVCESRNRNCLSPFYSARTMYGGASALLPYGGQTASRMRSASTSKLDVFSPRSQITMQPVPSPNKLNDQEILSASARRILDSLEKYCSPVADAKRIPVSESSRKSVENVSQSLNRGIKRKLPALNQMLPSTTELLRIKRAERIQDSISSAKQTVSTVPESSIAAEDSDSSSDSTNLDYSVLSQESKNNGNQYVRKLTRKNERKFDDRPSPSIHLPNATLKISNLPKFTVTDEFVFSKPLLLENLDEKVEESITAVVTKNETEPRTSSLTVNSPTAVPASPSFSNDKKSVSSVFSASTSFNDINSAVVKESPIMSKTNANPLFLVTSKSSASNSANFMKPGNSYSNGSSNSNAGSPKAATWTCMKCFTVNVRDECVKCSQSRPLKVEPVQSHLVEAVKRDECVIKSTTPTAAVSGWGDKFKPPSDTWECSECLVRNKNTSTECAACGKARNNVPKSGSTILSTGSTAVATTSSSSAGMGFDWKNLKKPAGWSCNNCYVQNKVTDTKCAACEQAREPSKNDATAITKEPITKPQFTFGIDKAGTGATSTNAIASASVSTFGSTNLMKFGSSDKSTTSTASFSLPTSGSTPATFSFGVTNSNSQPVCNVSSASEAGQATSVPTFTFGGDGAKAATLEMSASNVTPVLKNPLLSSAPMFSTASGAEKKHNSSVFNDVSSTSNSTKNPLLINDTSIFKSPKFNSPKIPNFISQENGEENNGGSSGAPNVNLSNNISSSTETPKKKASMFSSVLNSEPTNGFKNDVVVTNGGTSVVSSSNHSGSTNAFVTSLSTSAFAPASSKLTSNTPMSFSAAAAAASPPTASKTDATTTSSSFGGDKSNVSSPKLFGNQGFGGSLAASPSNPLLFGANANTLGGVSSAIAVAMKSSEAPSLNATAGGGTSATFSAVTPSFTFGANTVASSATAAPTALKSAESSLPASGGAPPSFTSITAQPSVFSFGSNAASAPASGAVPVSAQPLAGSGTGFMFNGPTKTEDGAAKFGFGGTANATPFGSVSGGVTVAGGTSQFSFNAVKSPINAANLVETNERSPATNALFGAAVNRTPTAAVTAAETTALNANSITAFGNNVFGAAPSQPAANPAKKSGGFSFNAPSPFTAPAVNNFSNFAGAAATQEPNRLNNSVTPAPSTFVFGSTNQTPQTHNFNPTIPPAFNFSGGNQLMSFSAQPAATNATPNACGAPRKIKKAVRRTTQK